MKTKTVRLLNAIRERIHSPSFKEKYRCKSIFFIRSSPLDFSTVMLSILNHLSKSLQVELTKFLLWVKEAKQTVSKQAFSRARYKIKHESFIELRLCCMNQELDRLCLS